MTYTRKQYLNDEVDHQTYYAQFATPAVIGLVGQVIGRDRILASEDPHLNDIPLRLWDSLHHSILNLVGSAINTANGGNGISLSDTVCTAKAAARMIQNAAEGV